MLLDIEHLSPEPLLAREWAGNLDAADIEVILDYTSNGYFDINGYLRRGRTWLGNVKVPVVNQMRERIINRVEDIESIPCIFAEDSFTVLRAGMVSRADIARGEWTDPAFCSATLSDTIALRFLNEPTPKSNRDDTEARPCILEITLDVDTPYLPVSFGLAYNDIDHRLFEQEILLPPNLIYRVTEEVGPDRYRVDASRY